MDVIVVVTRSCVAGIKIFGEFVECCIYVCMVDGKCAGEFLGMIEVVLFLEGYIVDFRVESCWGSVYSCTVICLLDLDKVEEVTAR